MKSISVIAAAAIAVRHADAASRPEIITAAVTETPNCKLPITKEMLTAECGYSLDKPCYVTRKYDPDATPSNMCNKKYIVASNSISMPNMIYVQAIENDKNIAEDFRFHQKAWQGICPYQCKNDGTCKNNPKDCGATGVEIVFPNYIQNGMVIPGSASSTVNEQDVQWMSLGTNGERDNVDNSAAINRVQGQVLYDDMFGEPTRITAKSTFCQGLTPALTLQELMNTNCGANNQVPCPAALVDVPCGECRRVTIFTDGLTEGTGSTPKICASGNCYMNSAEKIIRKVMEPVQQGEGFNRILQPGMGLFTQNEICPHLCQDTATGASVCVRQTSMCLATLAPNTTVPAADGWAEYVEPGSMNAGRVTVRIALEAVTCPTGTGDSAVGRTAGGFIMSMFLFIATAALM